MKSQVEKYKVLVKELLILKAELETGNTIAPVQKGRTTQINLDGIESAVNLLEYYLEFLSTHGEE